MLFLSDLAKIISLKTIYYQINYIHNLRETMNTPNTDKLHAAKIVDKDQLDADHIKAIESLSDEEVTHTINISQKLKDVPPATGIGF